MLNHDCSGIRTLPAYTSFFRACINPDGDSKLLLITPTSYPCSCWGRLSAENDTVHQESDIVPVDCNIVSHPYSIYIWQPPRSSHDIGHLNEPVQCFTEQWAVYVSGLMHKDSHSDIKVVRFGLNIDCYPDEHAVELVERQIARQHAQH